MRADGPSIEQIAEHALILWINKLLSTFSVPGRGRVRTTASRHELTLLKLPSIMKFSQLSLQHVSPSSGFPSSQDFRTACVGLHIY
jgi:hypothetical protein